MCDDQSLVKIVSFEFCALLLELENPSGKEQSFSGNIQKGGHTVPT